MNPTKITETKVKSTLYSHIDGGKKLWNVNSGYSMAKKDEMLYDDWETHCLNSK
jgi:hypothetical protein